MPEPEDFAIVIATTTVADARDAQRLAQAALHARLAACVQVETVRSSYWWQGTLHEEPELRLTYKCTQAAWPALRDQIAALHPYELPELCWQIQQASPAYAEWVRRETETIPASGQ